MNSHDRARRDARFGALRSALIGYGVIALTLLFARGGFPVEAPGAASGWIVSGLAIQVGLVVARWWAGRQPIDREAVTRAMPVLELVADGVTVLLFALGTFNAMWQPLAGL